VSDPVYILQWAVSQRWYAEFNLFSTQFAVLIAPYEVEYCQVQGLLRRGFGLVNRFIGSSLVVTTISSYTLKITVTVAYVTSHTKSYNSSSGHIAVPLELWKSSEVSSHSRVFPYPLGTDHEQKTQFYCCVAQTTR
jgi:hypothetical protein